MLGNIPQQFSLKALRRISGGHPDFQEGDGRVIGGQIAAKGGDLRHDRVLEAGLGGAVNARVRCGLWPIQRGSRDQGWKKTF